MFSYGVPRPPSRTAGSLSIYKRRVSARAARAVGVPDCGSVVDARSVRLARSGPYNGPCEATMTGHQHSCRTPGGSLRAAKKLAPGLRRRERRARRAEDHRDSNSSRNRDIFYVTLLRTLGNSTGKKKFLPAKVSNEMAGLVGSR